MARMLRTGASHMFACCDRCARKVKGPLKPDKRERRTARAREKVQVRRELVRDA